MESEKEHQNNYINECEKRIDILEEIENKYYHVMADLQEQKKLVERQQKRLLEQARYINRVKSSIIGKLLFK